MEAIDTTPFFRRDGDVFVPSSFAVGPWDPNSMHGRVLGGLLGRELEQRYCDDDFQFTRLTVDLFRLPPLEPVEVRSELVREGNRIRVADATVLCGGVEMARGRGVMLRRAEQPPGDVWRPPAWQVPLPDDLPEDRRVYTLGGKWETRSISGLNRDGFSGAAQKRTWLRELRDLVEGEPLTPFMRCAVAADYASPIANSGDQGLHFVNADFTLYLHRLPVGEWIGFEVTDHQSAEGVAIGDTTLYDLQGPIGKSTVCAVANRRLRA